MATAMWVVALTLETGGTVIGILTGIGAFTSIFMAWGIVVSVGAGTLTIKECTRRNRAVVSEAIRLVQRERVSEIRR